MTLTMIQLVKYISMGHEPNKNLGNALNKMANDIANEQSSGEVGLLNVNWPRIMWKIESSQLAWHPRAKKNGLSKRKREICIKGYNKSVRHIF